MKKYFLIFIALSCLSFSALGAGKAAPPSDLESESSASGDLRLTWDLGISTGTYRNQSYSEANLGTNLFFTNWLAWRNSVFGRFVQPKNMYGLDTSLRLIFSPEFMDSLGVTIFGGPGYRMASEDDAPFAEGGLVLHIGSFNVGAGVKTLFHSFREQSLPDDTQYFIILSGSGILL